MSAPSILIRSATPADIDAIMKIEYESFVAGSREDRDLYLKRIQAFSNGFLVAENTETGEVCGYISSELWREDQGVNAEVLALGHDPLELHDDNGTNLYITSFGTLQSWRGQKIGLRLFAALEDKIARDYPNVTKEILIVSEKWTAARHLYAKRGFKETGRIIDFFTPDDLPAEDAVIMMKDIAKPVQG